MKAKQRATSIGILVVTLLGVCLIISGCGPTPTMAPIMTLTSQPNAKIVAAYVTNTYDKSGAGTTFPLDTKRLYAVVEFESTPNDMEIIAEVHKNSDLVKLMKAKKESDEEGFLAKPMFRRLNGSQGRGTLYYPLIPVDGFSEGQYSALLKLNDAPILQLQWTVR